MLVGIFFMVMYGIGVILIVLYDYIVVFDIVMVDGVVCKIIRDMDFDFF